MVNFTTKLFVLILLAFSFSLWGQSEQFQADYKKHLSQFQNANTTVEMHHYASEVHHYCQEHLETLVGKLAKGEKKNQVLLEQKQWKGTFDQAVKEKIDAINKHKGTISSVNLELFKADLYKKRIEQIYQRYSL